MTTKSQQTETNLFPIRTVSDLTGVNAVTLRAWERRYGLLEPVRTESGHRLYTREHIDLIHRAVGLLDRGMRIGQVKAFLDSEETPREEGGSPSGQIWNGYINSMIGSVIKFDEERLEETYGEAMSNHPVTVVTEKVLAPLLSELGARWEAGRGSVAEEHFFSCYMRSKLGARFHHRIRTRQGPKLLLACLPEDRHEIGLLLFGLAANEAGFQVIMLGADMPLRELPAAASKVACDAVALSGVMPPAPSALKKGIPALVDALEVPLLIGGRASIEAHADLKKAGAVPLGSDINKSISKMRQMLLH